MGHTRLGASVSLTVQTVSGNNVVSLRLTKLGVINAAITVAPTQGSTFSFLDAL